MKEFNLEQYIMHHVLDSKEWHLPFHLPSIPLPSFMSLHFFILLATAALMVILFCGIYNRRDRVPSGMTNLLEVLVVFIRDEISVACMGEKDGKKYTPLFCTLFFYILLLNLIGLIPMFPAATSNLNVTGALALVTLSIMVFGSLLRNGPVGFAKSFVPSGIPWPILFIIVPIEILGPFIKSFALMIRLFANIIGGHIVVISILSLLVMFGWIATPALMLVVFISLLEVFVAFLQAYVFTLLSAIFIGQMYHPQH